MINWFNILINQDYLAVLMIKKQITILIKYLTKLMKNNLIPYKK